jgi:SAM-dependent methyltransferase
VSIHTDQKPNFDDADFNAVYRGGDLLSGVTGVPWDIGAPQPSVVGLERNGDIRGQVLDAGCGLGDNAIYLAGRGYQVTAVDAASAAIDQARQRAGAVRVDFEVADATELDGYQGRFDTLLDSALYHTMDADGRRRYVAALHRAGKPGARLDLLCFADLPGGMPAPLAVARDGVHDDLAQAGWNVLSIEPGTFLGVATSTSEFMAKTGVKPDIDADGHTRLPIWIVRADRRPA